MIQALTETPIGRALLAYWDDLPLWTLGNLLLMLSLLPSGLAWVLGSVRLAIVSSWPACLIVVGLANALDRAVDQKAPAWRDLFAGPYAVGVSAWIVLALLALGFTFSLAPTVFVGLCVGASLFLLVVPLGFCLAVIYPSNARLVWRNAFVVTVHSPVVAVGLVALAALFGWIVVLSKGALLLVMPALWMAIAMYATQEITRDYSRI